jgi:hypothetical protein
LKVLRNYKNFDLKKFQHVLHKFCWRLWGAEQREGHRLQKLDPWYSNSAAAVMFSLPFFITLNLALISTLCFFSRPFLMDLKVRPGIVCDSESILTLFCWNEFFITIWSFFTWGLELPL